MILGIDTATTICSIALFDKEKVVVCKEDYSPNSHSEVITVLMREALEEAGVDRGQIEAIILADGPGSYTGLRIGTSAAKGLSYVLDIPLLAVSHLKATSMETKSRYPNADYILAAIDARRDNVYALIIDNKGDEILSVELVDVEKTLPNKIKKLKGSFVLAGNGAEKVASYLSEEKVEISKVLNSAVNLRHFAFQMLENQQFKDITFFEPFYMQSPRITQGKKLLL